MRRALPLLCVSAICLQLASATAGQLSSDLPFGFWYGGHGAVRRTSRIADTPLQHRAGRSIQYKSARPLDHKLRGIAEKIAEMLYTDTVADLPPMGSMVPASKTGSQWMKRQQPPWFTAEEDNNRRLLERMDSALKREEEEERRSEEIRSEETMREEERRLNREGLMKFARKRTPEVAQGLSQFANEQGLIRINEYGAPVGIESPAGSGSFVRIHPMPQAHKSSL